MTPRISVALAGVALSALGFFASAPQTQPKAANPIEAARQNNLGCAYMNQQLFEKGLKAFQQATELDPKLAVARLNEAIAFLNLQKVDEAKAVLEEVLRQDPKNPNAWYNLGMLAKNTGDAPAAIDAFKRVIELDASDADTGYFLGTAYVQAKQFPQAIEAFQHALQLNPLHASAVFGLSRAYQQSGDVDHAREYLKKFQYITQNKIGAPMSLAYGEQGQYSRAVESASAVLKAPAQIKVRFVDVTKEAGIVSKAQAGLKTDEDKGVVGASACFIDYDNDGKIDLFLADNGPQGGMAFYRNLGNGKFEDVTKQAGLDPGLHALSCTAGDYDNDGFADLAVSYFEGVLLLHNEKNGTFKDVSAAAGIKSKFIGGLTFIDYDHDGDIDLYGASGMYECVGNCRGSGTLWRNNGDGTFTVVEIGVETAAIAVGAIGTDYNNDRAIDFVIAGSTEGAGTLVSPVFYPNPREGKFIAHALIQSPQPTVGVVALDFDHDGWMDLAFTHDGPPAVTLWHNDHGKKFDQVT